ncbi:hypothetical protein [Stutzerimonas stutzeri]|uniref:Uncharacterized protein n=1 Tax=Stutzerimonas stutzeri TaxID=316 RepID=A0AA42TF22_STUST|nr:hypothetical protein [Stutzerimonas stutzeri]MDH1236546.1 hypothetical protein [Stutzerimonas stutzeri]
MQAENAEYMAKRAQKQEAFDNSWVGRSGVDPDSFTAGVIDGGAMLTAGAGYLAGTVLTAAPNTLAAIQELGTSDDVKAAYTRFKQGQASEADIALLNEKQDLFTTNQEGLERADHLREGTRGIMDLFDWKGAIDAPQREPLREEFAEEAGPAVDRLAQAWEQVKEGEYTEAAKGAGWALPKVAYEIAENAVQHPVGAVTHALENAPQLAAGVAGKLPMAVSNAGYALDEVRQGMDNYEQDNDGARPTGGEFREMLLRAGSLAAAEHIADTQVLKTLTSPVTKTAQVLPEKAVGALAKPAKAAGTVLGTGATEAVTEAFQTYQEGEIKNREASPMDIAEGALLGFAAGGATAAASKAPADLLGSTGEKKEPEVEKARETGNVSSLLQPGAYAPEKAAKALAEHSLKNEDTQVRQDNLAKLGEIRSALEDEAKAEAMVERIQQRMESAPQEQQPQLEALLAQATESLTAIRAALGLKDVPATERKEALAKQLDQVKQAEASITQLMEPEKQDLSSQIELADTVLENVTPEVQQIARKAAERVVSLAMESPEALDVEVATRLASNMANSLTEPERVVLRTFAKAKALAHQVKGMEGVSSDIFNGNPKEGYKGLNEYSSNVRRALAYKTPDLEAAQHEIDGLAKFVASRKAKLAVAQKAFDEVAGTQDDGQQWLPTRSGTWVPADRKYSYDEMYAMGGMTIHGGSGNLVANIAQETEALEASLQSLQALYDMKSAAPVQTTVNQPEAAAPQAVEPVEQKAPVQTPEQEAGIAEDATEAVKYRKTNNLKRLFTQQPGNAKTGTQRPLVATENFLTKLSQGEVNTLDYVQQEDLSEEQLGLPSAFIRTAKTWMPTIEGNFFKRTTQAGHKTDARDHYYNDYTQYLQDEQGQVAENVKTAIAAAAFAHVADNGGQTLNDNTTINKILGKDKDASITPTANQKLRRIGTLRSAMINSLGQAVVQSLGYQLKGDASQSEKAKLEVALGSQVLGLLLDRGIVEQTTLTKGELDDLKGVDFNGQIKAMRAVAKTQADRDAITKLIESRKNEVAFIRFVTNKDGALTQEAQAIRDASKNTGGLFTKLFGIETGPREPSFKPLKYDQKTANNSTKPISDKERAALEKEAKAPYILQKDMWAALEKITDPAMILQMAGVQDEALETLHKTNRDGVTAKNQGLRREWERLVAFVNDLSRQKAGQDTKFYLMPSAWKNDRVGLDSAINPQTSKIHRFVVGKQSAETVVRWTEDDQTNLDVFKLRVAEGLGVKTDKQDNKRSLAAYEAEMQKPVYRDAVAALRKALLDQDLTSGEQQVIVEGVKAGGENFHSLSSLVAQATYENARDAGQQKFTTMLLAEVDGVTNGPMLGHLLFGAFGSLKDAMTRLNKGGFFENGNAFEQYNLWRAAPGQSDLYESTAIDLNKVVQKKWQDKKLQPVYSALFYVTGSLDDKGSPTRAGRELMKPPVTKSGYGEGLGKTVETMAEDFIQQVYNHIQKISAGKSELELQPLLSSVRLLISKADEKAAAELDVNMPIEKAMEFTFTNQQFKALKSTYLSTLGSDITATIKEAFGPFTERRQAFKEKLFENSEALFTKGYTPEIHNPHTEVLAATEEEGEALVRQGFQRVVGNPLNQDADDLDKRAKHLYILKGRGMQQRLTGALSYTGERAKGSRKHGGIVNTITGSLNTHNAQVTQRLARAKRVREEMAIQQGKPMGGVHMVPVLNAAGEIVNYRYVMSNKARDSLLERTNAFDTLLGTLHGNVFDKQASREQNAQVVKALFDQWNADKDNRRDAYIMVGPDSSDAEGAETWRLLPHHTQEVIRQVWKGNNMMVRNDQIDLIAGYRKYSLADMFDKQERTTKGMKNLLKHQEDERNMLEQMTVWLLKDLFGLGDKAALRVRQAEDFWQAVVQEVKDIVVVRSGVTLFWNVVSNMTVLLWQGVPVKDLMRNHWVAWRGAVNYRKDSEELFRLEAALSTGTSGDAKATQQRIRQLQDSLARNPAKELIDAGMLPTIVEDVALEEDPYSYRSMLKEKVDKYTSKLNPTVKQAAAFVYMAPGTSLHTAMSQATQYSDFVARYTLYQHLISDKKAPKSKQEALKRISDSFVNYDVPSHRHMQYLNDMGLLMFTKYYLRIQKVIMQMFREHPARAIMMVTLDSYLQGMQTIVDSSMWGRLGNPLEWGALQYPGTLDELATIKGMMNLFK